jgi:hypothetical protein
VSDQGCDGQHVTTRPGRELTLHNRLSQLDFVDACKLLGPTGAALIRRGGQLVPDVLEPLPVGAKRATIRFGPAARPGGWRAGWRLAGEYRRIPTTLSRAAVN